MGCWDNSNLLLFHKCKKAWGTILHSKLKIHYFKGFFIANALRWKSKFLDAQTPFEEMIEFLLGTKYW